MIKAKNKYINILILIISIIALVSLCSIIHPTLYLDEQYTMSLIHHSYKSLISINMLDVHPPTYYLLLKTFIRITTFWTSSVFIKVLFARIFSILCFIIMLKYLYELLNICDIHINLYIQIIFYLLSPIICLYSLDIRMYSLYGLFTVLMFVQLVKFNKYGNVYNIILSTIYAIITSYVDYFAAVCVGVFIIISFVRNIMNRKNVKAFQLFISGITLLTFCTPLIYLLFKQIMNRKKYEMGPHINSFRGINDLIDSFTQLQDYKTANISFVLLVIIYIIVLKFINNKIFHIILSDAILNYMISFIIAMIICSHFNIFEPKFFYPQYIIYLFFVMAGILVICKSNHYKYVKYILGAFITIMILNSSLNIYHNLKQYVIPTYSFCNIIKSDKNSRSSKIYLNSHDIPKNIPVKGGEPLYITQFSTFLQFYHKRLIVKSYKYKTLSLYTVNGNNKLMHRTFNNLETSR